MKKGVKKLIGGGLLLMVGLVIPFACFIPMFFQEKGSALQAPGSLEISIKTPGKYVLWNNYSTVFEGRSYSFRKELPNGLSFSLNEKSSGSQVPFQSGPGMLFTSGSEGKASVGSFEVAKAGRYLLTVTGNPEKRIFSFERSLLGKAGSFFLFLVLGILLSFAAGAGALVFIVLGIVDLVRENRTLSGVEGPANASPSSR
jgi:hypothetical protein